MKDCMKEVVVKCNSCPWIGHLDELKTKEDLWLCVVDFVCPECGSSNYGRVWEAEED